MTLLSRISEDWVPPGAEATEFLTKLATKLGGGRVKPDERGRPELVLPYPKSTKKINQVCRTLR